MEVTKVKEIIKETLEKQLQLLSERSRQSFTDQDLALLTSEMVKVCGLLLSAD